MPKIESLIRRAAQLSGVVASNDNAVPGDIASPVLQLLRDMVDELNAQNEISFGSRVDGVSVIGSSLTFCKTGDSAQDVLIGFVPLVSPDVIYQGRKLEQRSISDALSCESSAPECFAFVVGVDNSQLIFNCAGIGEIKIVSNSPIEIDAAYSGSVHVPECYTTYLTTKLAAAVASFYQRTEKMAILSAQELALRQKLATNNLSHSPIRRSLCRALNKFNGDKYDSFPV